MEQIKFQVEFDRVIEVLAKEIYDSPYALLRENIQNAYDAILMRSQYSEGSWSVTNDGVIDIQILSDTIIITDNGIGMSESVLKNNFWKAGSSGKKTELAMKSGVVGTFGIGGMANFGVCNKLIIETESVETNERIISDVEKSKLSLTHDCINIQKVSPTKEYGTKIIISLDDNVDINLEHAKQYLSSYVKHLPVTVKINDEVISLLPILEQFEDTAASLQKFWTQYQFKEFKADVLVQCNETGRISSILTNIALSDKEIPGVIALRQDGGHLWGYRSSFGLAPIPIKSHYSFGGIVNISVLTPTAGREALSRDSIEITKGFINLVEHCVSQTLSESELSNKNTAFMSHIYSIGRIDYASKLKIRVDPIQQLSLGKLKELSKDRKYNYYEGNDESIITSYATPSDPLVILSTRNPRRRVESNYIQKYCNINVVTDAPQVLKIYSPSTFELDELSFKIKVQLILEQDYALKNAEIKFAKLSHNLPIFVQNLSGENVEIFIQRRHNTVQSVLQFYSTSYDIFPGFIKDYIRQYIYPRIQKWVPSSTREGADVLRKILRQRRELFLIEREDVGLTSILADYIAGKVGMRAVTQTANRLRKVQTEEILKSNVGTIENEIPDLVLSPVVKDASITDDPLYVSAPPINRSDVETNKKLLISDSNLNNFNMFLAISDRAFRHEYDFFIAPHKTRIIWGGHRILFIFTHASDLFSIYYRIELLEDDEGIAGGRVFSTTTIVTKDRIFIPVPKSLERFFLAEEGKKQFYVTFDTISS